MTAWRSNLPRVMRLHHEATDAGLHAAGQVVRAEVIRGLAGGYKSGAFVTGNVLNSVTVGEPEGDFLARMVRIGTNVPYALFWELGHMNPFTRRFERKEVWRPALAASSDRASAAFARTYARVMDGGSGPPLPPLGGALDVAAD